MAASGALPRSPVMPSTGRWLLAALALALVVGLGAIVVRQRAARPAPPPTVAVARGPITATFTGTGTVAAAQTLDLMFQTGGTVSQVLAREGDVVSAGQPLARLDTAQQELKVRNAESALRTAQTKLAQLKAGTRSEDIVQAEAAVGSAQAKLADVKAGATAQEVAAQQAAVENAAAAARQAQAKLDQVRAGPTAADLSAAENGLASARASLQKAQLALDTLRAGAKPEDVRQQELAVEQAKNALWSKQLSRDATCGRGSGGPCDAAKAEVAAAESSVTQANEKLKTLKNPPDPKDVAQKQADVDSATDAVRNARVKLDQLRAGPTAEDVRQAQAAVEAAQATHRQASAKLDALRQDPKAGDVAAAQAQLVQAQQQLAIKQAPSTVHDLALAEEQVTAARVSLEQARLELDNATLKAPFAAVVNAVNVVPGSVVTTAPAAGAAPVFRLIDRSALHVDLKASENDVVRLAPGQPATVTSDAIRDWSATGTVDYIAAAAEVANGVVTYLVRVSFLEADPRVRVGMTASVGVATGHKDDAVLLPTTALLPKGAGHAVRILGPDGQTTDVDVQTGLAGDGMTEIVRGLAEGDRVVALPAAGAVAIPASPFQSR